MGRKAHQSSADGRMLFKHSLEISCKGILGIDAIQPISNTTQLGIDGLLAKGEIGNPILWHSPWSLRLDRESTVPNSGVMGAIIAQRHQCLHPTLQKLMVVQTKLTSYLVLGSGIPEIAEQLGKRAKRDNLQSLPYRR